ncbi:hypothetical protein J416_13574 [Gracilibacillus halophilus YIM-C55.5]|uniref:Spore coat protein CotO n=1 Tax=Gracilibacillus halophilus YIM-C55.5 TaxID=1308866 RepID=N4WIB2_9BACI|nr:CotO family spore coat protein [Gracilibacillus halophilus]ENH95917.1 hypothetical protein J416_13574 [Gracilibacillus halophilus YIM-C55.5]
MKRKRTHIPRVYVDQPHFIEPNPAMQYVYRTKKRSKATNLESTDNNDPEKKKRQKTKRENGEERQMVHEDLDANETIGEDSDQQEDHLHAGDDEKEMMKVKKRFKDMTLEEKVIHFANKPFHVPKAKCHIITEQKGYFGYIDDYQDDMVIIKLVNRARPISIPFEQIEEIKLIGF